MVTIWPMNHGGKMRKFHRIVLALAVLISGVALLPAIGLPVEGFSWQRYANVYQHATLEINHDTGQPGSFFAITGSNFSPNAGATITANGTHLGTVQTDSNGDLAFNIDSTGAELGLYVILATTGESATTRFTLVAEGNLWPLEGTGPVLTLPPDIAGNPIYLPITNR
jgi:hypothetical protein